jgi:hypothetical protein
VTYQRNQTPEPLAAAVTETELRAILGKFDGRINNAETRAEVAQALGIFLRDKPAGRMEP